MSKSPTVVVRNLSKTYELKKGGLLKGRVFSRKRVYVNSLVDLSFVAYSGQSIGILGKNGSGKSTLMRHIAGTENPTRGEVLVSSQPTLLGVSAALQPHLSGAANTRIGLLAMGLTNREAADLSDEVLEWAEIREAADRPLQTYSSGMKARLKFSIATSVKREILLIDEALATGDAAFVAKAKARMDSFLDGAGTVFLVSHGAGAIKAHCSRAIWLHEGQIIADADSDSLTNLYTKWSKLSATGMHDEAFALVENTKASYVNQNIILKREAFELPDNVSPQLDLS